MLLGLKHCHCHQHGLMLEQPSCLPCTVACTGTSTGMPERSTRQSSSTCSCWAASGRPSAMEMYFLTSSVGHEHQQHNAARLTAVITQLHGLECGWLPNTVSSHRTYLSAWSFVQSLGQPPGLVPPVWHCCAQRRASWWLAGTLTAADVLWVCCLVHEWLCVAMMKRGFV